MDYIVLVRETSTEKTLIVPTDNVMYKKRDGEQWKKSTVNSAFTERVFQEALRGENNWDFSYINLPLKAAMIEGEWFNG